LLKVPKIVLFNRKCLVKFEETLQFLDHSRLFNSHLFIGLLFGAPLQLGQAVGVQAVGHLPHVLELLHQVAEVLQMLQSLRGSFKPELLEEATTLLGPRLNELDWFYQLIILAVHEELRPGLSSHHFLLGCTKTAVCGPWPIKVKKV
jgi:hypothetical protein